MLPNSGGATRVRSIGPQSVMGWLVLLMTLSVVGPPPCAFAARESESQTDEADDVRRMHERLVALSQGEGSLTSLRIEFMEGGMAAHRSFDLSAGKLVTKEWKSPGAAMIQLEGAVADSRVRELLRELIAKRYRSFHGTRFVPDAPVFLFRFYYEGLEHVDFSCEAQEIRESATRSAIRDAFMRFVSATEMSSVSDTP